MSNGGFDRILLVLLSSFLVKVWSLHEPILAQRRNDIGVIWLTFDGLVQDCSISIANALELLQSCTELSICCQTYGVSNHQPLDYLLNRYPCADQRTHQSSASLAFVRGIHRWPGNSPYKWPVTRKMFSLDDVIMIRTFSWTAVGHKAAA